MQLRYLVTSSLRISRRVCQLKKSKMGQYLASISTKVSWHVSLADDVWCRVLQLIYECKEVLTAAVTVKQYYVHMVGSVVTADDRDGFVLDIETYEDDLQDMLQVSFIL